MHAPNSYASLAAIVAASQPATLPLAGVSTGLIASRWESQPGRAAALRRWCESLFSGDHTGRWIAGYGSSVFDLLNAVDEMRSQETERNSHLHASRQFSVNASRRNQLLFASRLAMHRSDIQLGFKSLPNTATRSHRDATGDDWTLAHARRVVVLWLRKSSSTYERLLNALANRQRTLSVVVPKDDRLVATELREGLVRAGALVRDGLTQPLDSLDSFFQGPEQTGAIEQHANAEPWSLDSSVEWLFHRTRSADRLRPGEKRAEFFRRLLNALPVELQGPLGTLYSILRSERLIASSGAVRGSTPMVCWTEQTPLATPAASIFRPARRQWDEFGYGLAVKRQTLIQLGARPAIYSNESSWEDLDQSLRPWYQPASSQRKNQSVVDWSDEKEWRSIGDLRLSQLHPADLFLYVPSRVERDQLQRRCRFEVRALCDLVATGSEIS